MHRENKSENTDEEKSAIPLSGENNLMAGPGYQTASGITINFHSAEFNHCDDLDDLSGNYRTFQPLDGVVTADMLHQMERRDRAVEAAIPNNLSVKSNELLERETGEPACGLPINLTSRGRILVIDMDAMRARSWSKSLNARGMTCTAVVTCGKAREISCSRPDGFPLMEVPDLAVAGAFGNFSAMTSTKGEWKPLAEWLDDEAAVFDLVLDLQPAASYSKRSLPLGYYAPGPNPDHPEEIMAELSQMRGQFQKPQFTAFRQSHCLHHVSRQTSCQLCLDACPLSAIQSINRKLVFNHYLCQGCGICELVCPAGAVRLAHPSQQERLTALRESMAIQSSGMNFAPTLIIAESDRDRDALRAANKSNERFIYFAVDEIGHVGAGMMLWALIHGAAQVVVAGDPQNDPAVTGAVRRQAQLGRAILRGLGQPEDRIYFTFAPDANQPETGAWRKICVGMSLRESRLLPDTLSGSNDRRTLIRLCTRELYDRLDAKHPVVPLPEGSPFGAVSIASACTLCMACVDACPSEALRAGGGAPKLEFIESRCHQCGLCKDICPEKAIHLQPRMLCEPERVDNPVILHEVEAARCIECGVPFASQAMVSRIRTNLAGHWMYASEKQLRRLQMCRICRTRDALMSEDLKAWNQSRVR
ncbi:MAG: 4Fe-4S binding protein [Deltaproteobacteria bacterium]